MAPRSADETIFMRRILREVGSLEVARVWRNNVGAGIRASDDGSQHFMRFGLKGSADISGILLYGQRLEIECKSKTGSYTKDQKAFRAMIERYGGFFIDATDGKLTVEQIVKMVQDRVDFLKQVFDGHQNR